MSGMGLHGQHIPTRAHCVIIHLAGWGFPGLNPFALLTDNAIPGAIFMINQMVPGIAP